MRKIGTKEEYIKRFGIVTELKEETIKELTKYISYKMDGIFKTSKSKKDLEDKLDEFGIKYEYLKSSEFSIKYEGSLASESDEPSLRIYYKLFDYEIKLGTIG